MLPLANNTETGTRARVSGENEYDCQGPLVGVASKTSLESDRYEAEAHSDTAKITLASRKQESPKRFLGLGDIGKVHELGINAKQRAFHRARFWAQGRLS